MKQTELIKKAAKLYAENQFALALSTILYLEEDDAVNYLDKKCNWFSNPSFCNGLAQNEIVTKKLLSLKRVDEVLYKHFNAELNFKYKNQFLPFQQKVAQLSPDAFVKTLRVTQAFLKSSWRNEYLNFQFPKSLSTHQKVWKHLQQNDSKIWQEVEESAIKLLSSNQQLEAILIDVVIAIELAHCSNRNHTYSEHLGGIYSMFFPLLLSKIPKEQNLAFPSQQEVSDIFLCKIKTKQPVSMEVDALLKAIGNWIQFKQQHIDPYCYDLEITPQENNGLINYNRNAKEHYKWVLDGKRYEVNRIDFLVEAENSFHRQVESGDFTFKHDSNDADIEFETKCQVQLRALGFFMDEMVLDKFPSGNGLDTLRFYQPLIAASNMYEWFYDNRLHCELPKADQWFDAFSKMFAKKPKHMGLDNYPFLYLTPKELYDVHDAQTKIAADNIKPDVLCNPFCYVAKSGSNFDRFNLHYDVFRKPFLKFDNFIFCPAHFFAKNDWLYTVGIRALEILDNPNYRKIRKETALKMEVNLAQCFKDAGFNAAALDEEIFGNVERDVDIHVTDGVDTILIQLKRTKLRMNLKDTYYESIHVDRKAARQLNKAIPFLLKEKPEFMKGTVHKWIVTTSCENVLTDIDDCQKVNHSDLILLLKFMAKSENNPTIQSLTEQIESDFNIRKVIDLKKILQPKEYDIYSLFQYRDQIKKLNNNTTGTDIYRLKYLTIDLPLPVDETSRYRELRFADNENSSQCIIDYNNAMDADNNDNKELAKKLFEKCLQQWPNDFDTIGALANIYADLGEFQDAFKLFKQALEISPNDPFINRNYAIALNQSGNIEASKTLTNNLTCQYWFIDLQIFAKITELPNDLVSHVFNTAK